MRIHREGYRIIIFTATLLIAISLLSWFLLSVKVFAVVVAISLLLIAFALNFFRRPVRMRPCNNNNVYGPCDGKVVVIEEVDEPEFLNQRCIQVSIFMSIWNVHINWYPIAGRVIYKKYHPGKFLVAWNPKSSELNERTTVVIERADGTKVMLRQIAGLLARRIKCYARKDKPVSQGKQLGFIKFGSRVDLFLPLGTKIDVELNQKIVGKKTIIAHLEERQQ